MRLSFFLETWFKILNLTCRLSTIKVYADLFGNVEFYCQEA